MNHVLRTTGLKRRDVRNGDAEQTLPRGAGCPCDVRSNHTVLRPEQWVFARRWLHREHVQRGSGDLADALNAGQILLNLQRATYRVDQKR